VLVELAVFAENKELRLGVLVFIVRADPGVEGDVRGRLLFNFSYLGFIS
jgi:hypothetical protein